MVNLSGTLNACRLFWRPSLCLPHVTVSSFDKIPLPISRALARANGNRPPDIKALVLDKDNCFAIPHENVIYGPYKQHFEDMRTTFSSNGLLIVSNSAGTRSDIHGRESEALELSTGVTVFTHSVKKPGCWSDVYNYLQSKKELGVTHPSQVAVVGDRLLTDIMMAHLMGCWAIWVKDGVVANGGVFARIERSLPRMLNWLGVVPPRPG